MRALSALQQRHVRRQKAVKTYGRCIKRCMRPHSAHTYFINAVQTQSHRRSVVKAIFQLPLKKIGICLVAWYQCA